MQTNWLKIRRKQMGLTQEELAARLQLLGHEVTAGAISHWETGRFQPPFNNTEFRVALAHVLRLDIGAMLQQAGFEVDTGHTPQGERVAHMIDQIPSEQRDKVVKLLETYLEVI